MFKKGDILFGGKRSRKEACHPIIFIDGPASAPFGVILTHSNDYKCNFKLANIYNLDGTNNQEPSYFGAHLIEKMSNWGPYHKKGEINKTDLGLIEANISEHPITWRQYLEYKKNGSCPNHR